MSESLLHPSFDLKNLDWQKIVDKISGFATSELSREKLKSMELLPSAEKAQESFDKIFEFQSVLKLGRRPYMESLDLYSIWATRLSRGATLKTLELRDVRHFCIEVLALSETLEGQQGRYLKSLRSGLFKASEPLSAIDQIMSPDGEIRSDASELLYKLTREKTDHVRSLHNALDRLIKTHEMEPVLQDRYVTTREGRWVIPVKSGMQHRFEGIIHASSQSKQTVFMEPQEVVPINNRLRQIDSEIEDEIERLLSALSGYLKGLFIDFETAKSLLIEADQLFAKAQLSESINALPCEFSENEIELIDLKHPLLCLNPNEKVIGNTVNLNSARRILLLSGPNAGGKTVLLKSIGLAAQMACCGLPICADTGSRLPFFSKIHVGIGDSQSVDAHLSTFAAHLKILNECLSAKSQRELLLIDEICGSTDPEEGAALARSFINSYSESGVFAVITSHLGALKTGWDEASGVINGSLEFNPETGPTYQFFMGIPGQSLAIQTALRVGVDSKVVENAMAFLSPEHRKYQETLKEVESFKKELQNLKSELLKERDSALSKQKKYEKLIEKFHNERDEMLNITVKRAERKIETLIEHQKVDSVFKKHEELQKIKSDLPEIIKPPAGGSTRDSAKINSAEEFAKAYPPGSKVYVQSIAKDGVVQGTPNAKGEVLILSQSMRIQVPWSQLKSPHGANNPTQDILRKSSHFSFSNLDTDRSVDLRGKSTEEAIKRLEMELDKASLNAEDRVKVVHGHGTEALKKSIRSYLSRSLYVKKWVAGGKDSGGDGVTWVELGGV